MNYNFIIIVWFLLLYIGFHLLSFSQWLQTFQPLQLTAFFKNMLGKIVILQRFIRFIRSNIPQFPLSPVCYHKQMFNMLIFGFKKATAENTAVPLNYPLLPSSLPLNLFFFQIHIKNQILLWIWFATYHWKIKLVPFSLKTEMLRFDFYFNIMSSNHKIKFLKSMLICVHLEIPRAYLSWFNFPIKVSNFNWNNREKNYWNELIL